MRERFSVIGEMKFRKNKRFKFKLPMSNGESFFSKQESSVLDSRDNERIGKKRDRGEMQRIGLRGRGDGPSVGMTYLRCISSFP